LEIVAVPQPNNIYKDLASLMRKLKSHPCDYFTIQKYFVRKSKKQKELKKNIVMHFVDIFIHFID